MIGIKKELEKNWELSEWQYELKARKQKGNKGLTIIIVYNNVGVKKLDRSLRDIIESCEPRQESIYIVGDLNARTGEETGCKDDLETYDVNPLRKSQDKVVNGEGKKLLKICSELGISILNGRVNGDQLGAITFIGGNEMDNNTVIDLVMRVGPTRGFEVKKLKIVARTESDHLPVVLTLGTEGLFGQGG